MANYDAIIQAAAQKYNVDPALIRGIIAIESSGNPSAVGKTKNGDIGGTGLMGINPVNFKAYGVTDPNDPVQSINTGTAILSGLLDKYGDVNTALTHYVGGDDPKQWGAQTAAYPGKVLAAAGIGSQQSPAAPTMLPGIPTSQAPGAQSDDAIFAQFSKGAAPASAQQGPQSDDAIFAAMTKAGQTAPATAPAPPQPQTQAPQGSQPGMLASFGAGLGRGVQQTALAAQQLLGHGLQELGTTTPDMTPAGQAFVRGIGNVGQWLVNDANQGLTSGAQQVAQYQAAHPIVTGAGVLTGQLAATAPLAVAAPAGTGLLGLVGRGAVSGAAMGAVSPVDPNSQDYWREKAIQAGTGTALGAASPVAVSGISALGNYAGNALGSLVRPFTTTGRQQIAQQVIANAAKGGPTALDLSQVVPGSAPTLAEATGNPGIATLQRTFRDLNPAPFVAREEQNAAARASAFGAAAGDKADIAAAEAARDAQATAARNQIFANGQPTSTQPVVDAIDSILVGPGGKRPSVVTSLGNVRNLLTDAEGNALPNADPAMLYQSVRKGINDMIDTKLGPSANPAGVQASRELLQVRDALDGQIDSAAPGFQQYLSNYSNASTPIDAMRYLQGLNLTDQQGNITLSKVQSALRNLQKQQGQAGANDAKSVSASQIDALTSIRDDLLRSTNTGLGRSAGSSTAQNLASQQSVASLFPGKLGTAAAKLPAGSIGSGLGGVIGFGAGGAPGAAVGAAIGSRVGSGLTGLLNARNEAIQNEVTNLLLNPSAVAPTLNGAAGRSLPLAGNIGLQRLLYPGVVNGGLLALRNNRGAQ